MKTSLVKNKFNSLLTCWQILIKNIRKQQALNPNREPSLAVVTRLGQFLGDWVKFTHLGQFLGVWVKFTHLGQPVGPQIAECEKAPEVASEPQRSSTGRRKRMFFS